MTMHDLRDVLRERAEAPAPANPYRHDQVRARVRKRRLRRQVAAGTAAVAAVAIGVTFVPGTAWQPRDTTVTTRPATGLPERFTTDDGTRYVRLAATTLKATGTNKTSVTIPVSGKPLDVAGLCRGKDDSRTPRILVDGTRPAPMSLAACLTRKTDLVPLSVPKGAKKVTVTFDEGAWDCGTKEGEPCPPDRRPRADWNLAVYEWTPPARPVVPKPAKDLPRTLGDMKLAGKTSGVWPKSSSFKLTVTSPGGKIGIKHLCTGDLASRMHLTYRVDRGNLTLSGGCGDRNLDTLAGPSVLTQIAVPKGEKVTVSGTTGVWGGHPNRQVRWSVGVYAK